MNPTCEIEKPTLRPLAVEVVRVQADADADLVRAALMYRDRLKEIYEEVNAAIEQDVTAWVKEHGPLRIGEMLWMVTAEKKTPKCKNVPAALEALLMKLGGDFGSLSLHLSANPIKYGSFRTEMGDKSFAEHFVEETVDKLSAEPVEKAAKKLRKMNTAFLPK